MARYLSGGNDGGGSSANGVASASTVLVTGEAVQAGQMAGVAADGLAYYTLDPAGPGGALRPITGVLPSTFPYAAGPAVPLSVSPGSVGGCVLANGNAVLFVVSVAVLQFAIFSSLGVQLLKWTTVATNVAAGVNNYVVALAGGGFAFAYIDNSASPGRPAVAVYKSDGTVQLAAALVETGQFAYAIGIAPLNGGGFAVAYVVPSSACRYAIYSNQGAVVQPPADSGLPTALSSNSPCGVSVATLLDGGFVIAGLSMNTNFAQAYFSRFNAAGVAQQKGIQANAVSSSNLIGTVVVVGNTAGGFAIATQYGLNTGTWVSVFSAAGVLQGNVNAVGASSNNDYPGCAMATAPGGAVIVVGPSVNSASVTVFSAAGAVQAQNTFGQLGGCNAVARLANGHVVIAGNGPNVLVLNASNGVVGSVTLASLGLTAGFSNTTPPCILAMPASSVATTVPLALTLTSGNSPTPKLAALATVSYGQKTTPVGVFTASGAQGAGVPVQYLGAATLSTGFAQPFTLDFNGKSPPGQRMSVLGNQAILSGLLPARPRHDIN